MTAHDDLARRAETADSLSLAMLVLLERLSPEQRAVLLLREVFGYRLVRRSGHARRARSPPATGTGQAEIPRPRVDHSTPRGPSTPSRPTAPGLKGVAKVTDDRDALLAFCNYPAEQLAAPARHPTQPLPTNPGQQTTTNGRYAMFR